MILGRITGKITTTHFSFLVDNTSNKFEYVQVMHKEYEYVLCQIYEIEKDINSEIAKCIIIGYKDSEGKTRQPRTPFEPGTEVLQADEEFIKSIISIGKESGAYIGKLDGKDIKVFLDLNKLLTRHVCVLAKSGSGKSYTVAALLEEIIERKVPLLIIDPHGEYSSMKEPNDNGKDIEQMKLFGIKSKGYRNEIVEYGNMDIIKSGKQLKLNDRLEPHELIHLIPTKLSNNQLALLYSIMQNLDDISFSSLICTLEQADNNNKYSLISVIDYLRKTGIFSTNYTMPNELIQPGRCSIINLKGIEPEVQEIIVYKLLKDLFDERKKEKIPPFFCVIEEAHTFAPEQGYGKSKSSSIIKTIASEGRKFGLGLCIVSQRPAIVQKTVLSQCTTQIILKVTNPNDLKAIANSVEGVTAESETEIQNIPIGTALITGIVDIPLLVNIRPRRSKHGGDAVDILKEEDSFFDELMEFQKKELLPIIKPRLSVKDIKLMSDKEVLKITSYLIPCAMFTCHDESEFNVLMDMVHGQIIADIDNKKYFEIGQIGNIKENASYEKIEFTNVPYDEKVVKKINIDELMARLKKLTAVKDYKECYVLYYDVKYKEDPLSQSSP